MGSHQRQVASLVLEFCQSTDLCLGGQPVHIFHEAEVNSETGINLRKDPESLAVKENGSEPERMSDCRDFPSKFIT